MRKFIPVFAFCLFFLGANAQRAYWQQQVDYDIRVQLNEASHTLDGFMTMHYINHSPDTLGFIWVHLWPNAYKNDKTAFSDQLLENGRTDFYFSEPAERGYINRLDFRVNHALVKTEDHPEHIDIIKLILPQPLLPNDSIRITTPFHVQLPQHFSRGGHTGKAYQITQWYPKPAVYDQQGWHPMPYLDQGEFYAEFGSYQVNITIPQTYRVLSSGKLMNPEDDVFMVTLQPVSSPKRPSPKPSVASDIPLKTLRFKENNIHDFAWFAARDYEILKDSVILTSGRSINLTAAYFPAQKSLWSDVMPHIKEAVLQRSRLIGEYAYDHLSLVQIPSKFNGGMEYPCIATLSEAGSKEELHEVIAHEIGHNWFQGMIANNERRYAWMDEGLNTYYDRRFKQNRSAKSAAWTESLTQMLALTYRNLKMDQPVNTNSADLTASNYYFSSYYKPAQLFEWIESRIGRPAFDSAMQQYFTKWKFKHPQPDDLFTVLQSQTPISLDSIIRHFDEKGTFPLPQKERLRFGMPGPKTFSHSNSLTAIPLSGYNMYDGFMIGGLITNYQLPPKRFQFLLAPLYGTQSQSMNYAYRLGYTLYPDHVFSRIHFSIAGMKFSTGDFRSEDNRKYITGFQKIVPSAKFIFNNKNPRSSVQRYVHWKSFWIEEDRLRFSSVLLPGGGNVINIRKETADRLLHQLQLVWKDTRALYPYRAIAMAERSQDFTRLSFTGSSYLNYNHKQGASVRFFAGKFLYNGTVTANKFFRTSPFHLNLTGPRGSEDYTYSNYFIGRSEFEGFASQQIMMRDGGFKVRTDLLADKIGKTDNWLMALNLVSDIPERFNILNALPVKIPLKIFLDIGTYADTWQPGYEGSKILYNAGIQIPLLNQTVQLYIPLLYSKVYRDYINTTITGNKFLNTISFSIDIQELTLKKLDKNLPD